MRVSEFGLNKSGAGRTSFPIPHVAASRLPMHTENFMTEGLKKLLGLYSKTMVRISVQTIRTDQQARPMI